jgi:hypothetical protein
MATQLPQAHDAADAVGMCVCLPLVVQNFVLNLLLDFVQSSAGELAQRDVQRIIFTHFRLDGVLFELSSPPAPGDRRGGSCCICGSEGGGINVFWGQQVGASVA